MVKGSTGLKNRRFLTIIYCILGILAAVSVIQGCKNAAVYSQDFQWDAAKALFLGINPYEESLNYTGALNGYGFEEYFSKMEANQFPSLLMLLYPYTLLVPMAARYAWMISNLFFTALALFCLKKTFFKQINNKILAVIYLLMIAGTPWRNQIGVGQHTMFSFSFFLLAVWLIELSDEKKSGENGYTTKIGGLLLSIAGILSLAVSYFKYTLTVPLALYFVYKRKWKELIFSALIHVLMTFIAAGWLGSSFMDMIIMPLKVSSALSGEGGIDISVLMNGSSWAFAVSGLIFLILFTMVLFMPKGNEYLVITLLTLWSLVITYHRTYDFFILILPCAIFIRGNCTTFLRRADTMKNEIFLGADVTFAKAVSKPWNVLLFGLYGLLLLFAFFGLRLFNESTGALICTGFLYYLFIVCIMIIGFTENIKYFNFRRNDG